MTNDIANFLRDFAAANSDSFEPNQVQNLVYAANEIEHHRADFLMCRQMIMELNDEAKNLRAERDEARRNLCLSEAADLSFGENGIPYHPSVAYKIAEEYGWDCFDNFKEN